MVALLPQVLTKVLQDAPPALPPDKNFSQEFRNFVNDWWVPPTSLSFFGSSDVFGLVNPQPPPFHPPVMISFLQIFGLVKPLPRQPPHPPVMVWFIRYLDWLTAVSVVLPPSLWLYWLPGFSSSSGDLSLWFTPWVLPPVSLRGIGRLG